jgi:hypothetical protein
MPQECNRRLIFGLSHQLEGVAKRNEASSSVSESTLSLNDILDNGCESRKLTFSEMLKNLRTSNKLLIFATKMQCRSSKRRAKTGHEGTGDTKYVV